MGYVLRKLSAGSIWFGHQLVCQAQLPKRGSFLGLVGLHTSQDVVQNLHDGRGRTVSQAREMHPPH